MCKYNGAEIAWMTILQYKYIVSFYGPSFIWLVVASSFIYSFCVVTNTITEFAGVNLKIFFLIHNMLPLTFAQPRRFLFFS